MYSNNFPAARPELHASLYHACEGLPQQHQPVSSSASDVCIPAESEFVRVCRYMWSPEGSHISINRSTYILFFQLLLFRHQLPLYQSLGTSCAPERCCASFWNERLTVYRKKMTAMLPTMMCKTIAVDWNKHHYGFLWKCVLFWNGGGWRRDLSELTVLVLIESLVDVLGEMPTSCFMCFVSMLQASVWLSGSFTKRLDSHCTCTHTVTTLAPQTGFKDWNHYKDDEVTHCHT